MNKKIHLIRLQFEFLVEALELIETYRINMSIEKIEAVQFLMIELIEQMKKHVVNPT